MPQHLTRMTVEGYHNRGKIPRLSLLQQQPQQGTMPYVHPVKHADSNKARMRYFADIINIIYLHLYYLKSQNYTFFST